MPTSSFGWFYFGLMVGMGLQGRFLTFIEAKWHLISGRRSDREDAE